MAKIAASRKLPTTADVPARNTAVGRKGQRPPQPDRRLNILLAAEKLFALHGFHAVSIRQIAAEADVPLALIGYYYGSKNELYEAIFESWQGSIDQRLAALQEVVAVSGTKDAIEKIVEAFVGPVLAMHASPEGQYFAVMAARDLAAPAPDADRLERQYFDPMAHAFIDALLAACPGASRGQAAWCYQFAIGAMLHFLLSGERAARLARGEIGVDDPEAKALLMRFIASGFRGTLPR
ncbi:AcrR family transcriptional regulator [Mesorhizobium soli]|uniref:TetR/AcrR family transcriptional regulator n=1 Tax=Pseudaminobacter soli (ex Li et al. 2025) TaxID=1295366 RepID=UPI0024735BFE|nr:TetR/AcrR family transcriptional regulator [Mesorhizobium soli]MDH6229749.1 AcrR family transcriptional regulator [Mesorhizobium soli]